MGLDEALSVFDVFLPGELDCDIVATKSILCRLVVIPFLCFSWSVQSEAMT